MTTTPGSIVTPTDSAPVTGAAALQQYESGLNGQAILGNLIWYSVPETVTVKHSDLTKILTTVGLDAYVRPVPKDKDVFLRVASSHARKNVATDDPMVYENYLVRNVLDDGVRAVKQIVVEQVNASGVKLNLFPAVQIEYDNGKVTSTFLDDDAGNPIDHQQAMNVAELIEQDYAAKRGTVNAYSVRELIRRIILANDATTVRPSGGVYFLMHSKQFYIDALVALADAIPYVDVHPVPLVDNSRQREMLQRAVEAETIEALDKIINEIDDIDSLTPRKYQAMCQEFAELATRTKSYTELLDTALASADLRVNVCAKKIRALYQKVD